MIVNWCTSTRLNFILWNKVGDFRGFQAFDFGLYTEIENLESSESFSRLAIVLLEEVGNFRLKFSENAEIFSRLVIVLLEEVTNFRGFRIFDFGPYAEIKNLENSKIFSGLAKLSEFVLL